MKFYNDVIKILIMKIFKKIDSIIKWIFSGSDINTGYGFDQNKFMSMWTLYGVSKYANRSFNLTGILYRLHTGPPIVRYTKLKKSYEMHYG